ncbi:response regulator [Deinococcus radiotolerans]|uniref:Response regulator n=1 Tax=Deinococcus radiotolerans TaxID=1309407 RepID=A0ABQ2FHK3_9DEIO|nr:response regulator [Deinococcus radiotolerans]GGK93855.1 response regulator [Deinococcus radiotolerans]
MTSSRHLCILLIDDNPADCLLAEEAFEMHAEQVTVKVIQDGQNALNWLQAQAAKDSLPDVVLLDVNMPAMSGFEVLTAIRGDTTFRHLPVVMLTTSDREEDIDRAYELVASSYLVKRRDFQGFLDQVDSLVRFWSQVRFRRRTNLMS